MSFEFHRLVIGIFAFGFALAIASTVSAQQFQEQSSTRFPQPAPSEYTNQATVGDLDGDGDLDIVWANGGNFSSPGTTQFARIFINDGTGVFTDESVVRGAVRGLARGVELGDIDGDDDLDMIIAQDFNRRPTLLVNDGNGFFSNETFLRLPPINLSSPRAQFGDIDNDGDLDLYICHGGPLNRFGSGQNRIYINDGDGFFADETNLRHPPGTLPEPMDASFGDIDGDFDLDIRTASTASNASRLYRNNGAGVYLALLGVPSDNNAYSYDFGDIDGDGDLDLFGANASASGNNSDLLLQNDGSGGYSNVSGNISPNPSVDDNDSKFFDYDNDGDLDLIVARLGGSAERIYNNNGAGVFTEVAGLISSISDSSLDIMVADLTGDGRLDIITAQGESGSFINRFYVNVTGPVDTRAPRIIDTEQLADTSNDSSPYVVRAAILDDVTSDRNFFDGGITLNYSIDAGPMMQVPMRYSGGQIYRGVIPATPCEGGVITYFVAARDFAGNLGVGDSRMFTVTASVTPGDINSDTLIDETDAAILANVLIGLDTDPSHICRADVNDDGDLNGLDVSAFIDVAL